MSGNTTGLVLDLSEDAWMGNAQFTVSVDGTQVGGTYTATASHSAGASQAFTIPTTLSAGSHSVDVSFINDAWGGTETTDRNLYLLGASYNGQAVSGSQANFYQSGSYGFTVNAAAAGTSAGRTPSMPLSGVSKGSQINASNTGPGAIGITSFTSATAPSSLTIRDQTSASFITKVNGTATYDGFTVNGPHLLVEGASIHSSILDDSTLPLVVIGSKIEIDSTANWGIRAASGAAPLYLLNSDISGAPGVNSNELVWIDGSNSVVYDNHIHGISNDGMNVGGGANNVRILDNLIDQWAPVSGAHTDGIQMDGSAHNVTFDTNKVLLNNGQTGAINMVGWLGATSHVTMDSNYLAGGSYDFYGPDNGAGSGNSFTNNTFGTDFYSSVGQYGVVYPRSWTAGDTWSNNRMSDGRVVNSDNSISAASTAAAQPSVAADPVSAPITSELVLGVSEDAWQGNAQFNVFIDGQQVGGTYTATASHAAGQDQTITLPSILENFSTHDIAITFLNDAYGGTAATDRNLYVNSAQFDGQSVPSAVMELGSDGTRHFSATAPAGWTG